VTMRGIPTEDMLDGSHLQAEEKVAQDKRKGLVIRLTGESFVTSLQGNALLLKERKGYFVGETVIMGGGLGRG